MLKVNGPKMQIVIEELTCDDVIERITTLTALVKAARRELLSDDHLYCIMNMIEDHLPGECPPSEN